MTGGGPFGSVINSALCHRRSPPVAAAQSPTAICQSPSSGTKKPPRSGADSEWSDSSVTAAAAGLLLAGATGTFLIATTASTEALTGTAAGETAETLATDPSEVEASGDEGDDLPVLESTEEELMDADDIEQNRADEDQSPSTRAREDKERSTDDFQNLDQAEIARSVHKTHETSFGRLGGIDPIIYTEIDEGHSEQEGDNAGEFFHSPDRLA